MKIGWAEKSITPAKPIQLDGQFYERISQYVESEISVTALAVEDTVICSCDLTCVDEELMAEARKYLTCGMDAKKLIVCATHTHTSIKYRDSFGLSAAAQVLGEEASCADEKLSDFIARSIAEAADDAWKNRSDCSWANGFSRAVVGHCRRAVYDDGSAKMWGDTDSASFVELEGGNDSGVELIFTYRDGALTGIVANVACPSQVLEHRSFISSDYWGKLKALIRAKYGSIFLLPLCAPAGDQCPRDLIRWVEPETPIADPNVAPRLKKRVGDTSMFDIEGANVIAKRLFNAIEEALPYAHEQSGGEFFHSVKTLNLPLRRVTPAQYEAARKSLSDFEHKKSKLSADEMAKMHVHAGAIQRYEYQQTHDIYPIELHTLRLGELALATSPFELFCDYGLRIKARSSASQTLLIQLACGSGGYLPTRKAERGGHYSAYVSSGNVGHAGGELLVCETLEQIRALFGAAL